MVIIEFFGQSGSGKSYFKKKLIKKYFYSSKTYDYKSINLNYNNRNYFVKIYFFLIKSVFIKKIKYFFNIKNFRSFFLSFFFKKYLYNIHSYKYDKKDSEKFRIIKSLIINSNFKKLQKKLFLRWAHEELIGSKLAREIKHINNILIDSEGLIQRLFIYCYKKKNKTKIIKKYLYTINLPDVIVLFKKHGVSKNNVFEIPNREAREILLITINELKKKNIIMIDSEMGIKNVYKSISKIKSTVNKINKE